MSQHIQYPQLKDAVKKFHIRASSSLEDLRPTLQFVNIEREKWIYDEPQGCYRRTYGIKRVFGHNPFVADAPYMRWSEWAYLQEVVDSLPEIKAHRDQLVGTILTSRLFTLFDLATCTLKPALKREAELFNEREFEASYKEAEDALFSKKIAYVRSTPILGANIDFADSLELSSCLRLRRLSQDEISDYLEFDTSLCFDQSFASKAGIAKDISDVVLERTLILDKQLGPIDPLAPGRERSLSEAWAQDLENSFIAAWRLHRSEPVGFGSALERMGPSLFSLGIRISHSTSAKRGIYPNNVAVSSDEVNGIVETWKAMSGADLDRRFLQRSIDRFSIFMQRGSVEDQVVDLAISGESLFLSGQSDHNELSYRLAHRAGAFLGKDREEKQKIFERFKDFYALRSKIVHGRSDPLSSAKSKDAATKLINETASDIRNAILKAVHQKAVSNPQQLVPDWKALLY